MDVLFDLLERRRMFSSAVQAVTTLTSAGFDSGNSVVTDVSGDLYVSGPYSNTVDFNPNHPGTVVRTTAGLSVYTAKYLPDGDLAWLSTGEGPSFSTVGKEVMDAAGNLYVTGTFDGTVTFGGGSGAVESQSNGATDAFVEKLNPMGNVAWAFALGGAGMDQGRGVAVDAAGDVFVAGISTQGASLQPRVFTTLAPADQSSQEVGFVAKLSPAGELLWSATVGQGSYAEVNDVATGPGGAVYLTGAYIATAGFSGTTQAITSNGGIDSFIAKYGANGIFRFAQTIGGIGTDRGRSVAVAPDGDAIFSGVFRQNAAFGAGLTQNSISSNGAGDAYVAAYSPTGALRWVDGFGGAGTEKPRALTVDAAGRIYVAGGYPQSANFNPDFAGSPITHTSAGSNDAFVETLDSSGAYVGSYVFGGTGNDVINSIAVEDSGDIAFTGLFASSVDFGQGELRTSGGRENAFIVTISPGV